MGLWMAAACPHSNVPKHWDGNMDLKRFHEAWVAVQVRPKYEFVTAKILRNKGYEEFVPTYQVKRQWSDRSKLIKLPLFAGYVFCRINAEICWPIVTTPGVIRILSHGSEIARIDENEISALQTLARSRMKAEPCSYVKIGQRVRVLDGPLAGVEALVTGLRSRCLILSVTLVQGSIAVELDGCSVEAIASSHVPLPAAAGCPESASMLSMT